jgi:hypothetical protein
VSSCAPSPGRTTAVSSITSWSRPCSASPVTAPADTRWKVPGVLDWSTGVYNPRVDITQDATTLYASDRDVFPFLVDDLNPIEAGKLPDGSPDLYFRGFYCGNSEVGAKTLCMASFYLRAVCQNRNLRGVEDFEEITIRHSKYAASRFAHEAAPALTRFANSSPMPFVNGIKAAREKIVARTDDDRSEFLRKRGFSKTETAKIIETVLAEEGRKPESVFDFVQGITAVARKEAARPGSLSPGRLEMRNSVSPALWFPAFPDRRFLRRCPQRKRAALRFVTGWRSRERRSAARRGVSSRGDCRSEDHPLALARHPLQQARAQPIERSAGEGRRLDRGTGRGHRPARPAPRPQRPAGRGSCGVETGMFEIPAGGRRFRALELLVKQKRLAKTAPVPCVVREGGIAEEDSLAENVQRAPLDQFRAFPGAAREGSVRGGDRGPFPDAAGYFARILPKITSLNSTSGASLFSTRVRTRASSQLFNMNPARVAAEH